jgi:SOS regulatory protein LexA
MGRDVGRIIRQLRQQRGLTQRAFAAAVGIHHTYLSKLENGRVSVTPTAQNLIAMADVLEIERDWLLTQCGRPPESFESRLAEDPDWIRTVVGMEPSRLDSQRTPYRLLGQVVAGQPVEAVEDADAFDLADLFSPGEHYLLKVRGESMIEDAIVDGDLAIVRPQKTCRTGQIVVAMVDGMEATLKRFYQEGRWIRLQPANSQMEPIRVEAERVEICGVVVGVIRSQV